MLGPKYSVEAKKGELGVLRVSTIIFESLGWIFKRTPQEFDFGIDGQVDVVDIDGTLTGQVFAVQIKYGKSFLKEESRWGYIYRGELKHINYLLNYPLPVFIMLCVVVKDIWPRFYSLASTFLLTRLVSNHRYADVA
ncbi:DUF4365 domain-containing protein [Pseudoalteromonas ulvae]|uniref:DUF4365 domain-containing protein n=1 Tax=Pseudoalteromonas ulvae TaxID=107327 RepID=A0A244CQP3_PSEDV|nr:DUF4365 domain-containing protein [Pseudoalteromonas ulvae]OUL57922.1 hypothetical protein B1199_06020 [Pseudoalteromonas ulvae]